MLDNFFNTIFYPFMLIGKLYGLIVLSIILTFVVTIIYKYTTKQKLLKDLKDEIKSLQKEMKELKGNPKKMMEVQAKMTEINLKYMSHSFKGSLITLIPMLIVYGWLRNYYTGTPLNFLGFIDNWIWVYIIISFVASTAFRKILKIY